MNRNVIWKGLMILFMASAIGCSNQSGLSVTEESWGNMPDGRPVSLFTLTNKNNVTLQITNYGGYFVSAKWADKNGKIDDVLLGHYSLDGYLDASQNPYFGGIIGRYANRIAKGKFSLDGKQYTLATNDGPNSLHGGNQGFDKRLWQAEKIEGPDSVGVLLKYTSADMEEGYPGKMDVTVEYSLNNNNELRLDYKATTDKKTVVNLTNHPYWNLKGQGQGTVLNHLMMINADNFTPIDSTMIPTGEIRPVEGTPFDFRKPTAIGARINEDNQQLKYGKGYDHNWVLNKPAPGTMTLAARVVEPTTGRTLEVHTTEPGIQFYSGNFLDGTINGKNGATYEHRGAFVLETQHYPDSPNQPNFPSTVLNPGDTYTQTTIYTFGVTSN